MVITCRIESPFFPLGKRKRPFMVKRKTLRDDLTPPCQITQNGAGRHALSANPTFITARYTDIPRITASPHLWARRSLGCKGDTSALTFRRRPSANELERQQREETAAIALCVVSARRTRNEIPRVSPVTQGRGDILPPKRISLGFSVPKRRSSPKFHKAPWGSIQIGKPARRTAPRYCCPSPSRP